MGPLPGLGPPFVRVRVSRKSKFYFKIAQTVGGTRRRLTTNGSLCYLKSVMRGNQRYRQLGGLNLVAVNRSAFSSLHSTGMLLQTRNRPPTACRRTGGGGAQLVSTAYPIMLRLRRHVGGRCSRKAGSGRVIVFNGGNRTRILKLIKRARKRTVIVRAPRRMSGLSFGGSVYLCSRAAGPLSNFQRVIRCVRTRVSSRTAFHCCSAVYQRMTGHVPRVHRFTSHRSIVLFIYKGGDSGKQILCGRYGDIGPHSCLVSSTSRVSFG